MNFHAIETADVLQIAGWLLTVVGQVQIALKVRTGFVTWTAANAVLIVLCIHAGLWWSIGMHGTNTVVCLWSYRKWGLPKRSSCSSRTTA
jgi:hypothetical protein